jgi:hypothetical protein
VVSSDRAATLGMTPQDDMEMTRLLNDAVLAWAGQYDAAGWYAPASARMGCFRHLPLRDRPPSGWRARPAPRPPAGHPGEVADLLVVTGPPGAGKSTITQLLARDFDSSALVAGDQFFGFLRAGFIDPWRPESYQQNEVVIQSAAAAVGKLVQGGITVVYDGVVGPWFVPAFLAGTGLDRRHVLPLDQRETPESTAAAVRERRADGSLVWRR